MKDFKVYELTLDATEQEKTFNHSLVISLTPFTGNPSLSMHCDERPKLQEFFEWSSDEGFHQEIVVTPEELAKLNCTRKLFYVGVSTLHPTSYAINSVINYGQTVDIEFNLPINGEVIQEEVVTYRLDVFDNKYVEINADLY